MLLDRDLPLNYLSASATFRSTGPRVDPRGVQALRRHPCGSERQSILRPPR